MIRNLAVFSLSGLLLGACAEKALPAISYDNASFKPATAQHDPMSVENAVMSPSPANFTVPPKLPIHAKRDDQPPAERVATANRKALHEPQSEGFVNAVQVYPFSDNALYRLYASPQQVSDIALQPGEALSAISAGDTVRWAVGDTASGNGPARQVHVLVKPFAAGLTTNLVILTNRRTYHLELQSTDRTAMAAVAWSYPQDGLITSASDPATSTSTDTIDAGLSIENLHFRYAITGDTPPWRPARAFDDGNKVYIEFPERIDQGEAPPLFVVGEDGSSDLVNYRVRGNYYIVDRLFAAAELRLGQDKQQVVRISRTDGRRSSGLTSLF